MMVLGSSKKTVSFTLTVVSWMTVESWVSAKLDPKIFGLGSFSRESFCRSHAEGLKNLPSGLSSERALN